MARRPRRPEATTVVGLDLSIRSAGVAVLFPEWSPGEWENARFRTFGNDDPCVHDTERFEETATRVAGFVADVVEGDALLGERPVAVFVEHYAFDAVRWSTPVTLARLAELGGLVKYLVWQWVGVHARPVTQGEWRKLLLGFARMRNVDVKAVAQERLRSAGAPCATGDELDALGVALFGRSELGLPTITFASARKGRR